MESGDGVSDVQAHARWAAEWLGSWIAIRNWTSRPDVLDELIHLKAEWFYIADNGEDDD